MGGRFLQRLEERVLPELVERASVVDDHHAVPALQRSKRQVDLHVADLLDRDVLLFGRPRDHPDVGMDAALDLPAGEARPASAGDAALALERLRQAQGDGALPDGARAEESVGLGQVAQGGSRAEPLKDATVPYDVT